MFPDVRLLIAAIVASVVALICGFGIFAAFRVNHDPLARLPSTTAPMRLAADDAATLSAAVREPFEHRFQSREPRNGGEMTALAYSATEPTEQPVGKAVKPAVQDRSRGDSVAEPAPPSEKNAAVAAAVRQTGQEVQPNEAAGVNAEAAPAAASSVAVVEPPAQQAEPAAPTMPEAQTAPASAPSEAAAATREPANAVKKIARARVAGRTHRAHRYRTTYPVAVDYLQPHFLTAPPEQQIQPARVWRPKMTSGITFGAPAQTGSGVGGPLVGPTGR